MNKVTTKNSLWWLLGAESDVMESYINTVKKKKLKPAYSGWLVLAGLTWK